MPNPETDRIRQERNLKEFNAWLEKHSGMILPIPNKGAIYAGLGKTNLKKMKDGLQAAPETVPMWKIIEKAQKDAMAFDGYVTIDTINDVLRRIKSPLPKLIEATGGNAGHPKKYSDMLSLCRSPRGRQLGANSQSRQAKGLGKAIREICPKSARRCSDLGGCFQKTQASGRVQGDAAE